MEKKERILQIKEELKTESKQIRTLKNKFKEAQRNGEWGVSGLWTARWNWRHKHIAYCLLRGRKIEDIERKVREGNEPSQRLIDKYIEEITSEISND